MLYACYCNRFIAAILSCSILSFSILKLCYFKVCEPKLLRIGNGPLFQSKKVCQHASPGGVALSRSTQVDAERMQNGHKPIHHTNTLTTQTHLPQQHSQQSAIYSVELVPEEDPQGEARVF
jgi:hypothetical protein